MAIFLYYACSIVYSGFREGQDSWAGDISILQFLHGSQNI